MESVRRTTPDAAEPERADTGRLTVHVPIAIRKYGGRKVVIAPNGDGYETASLPNRAPLNSLIKPIARAHRWQRLLDDGTYASIRDLAAAEKISASYVSRLLRLTLLEPKIVEQALG